MGKEFCPALSSYCSFRPHSADPFLPALRTFPVRPFPLFFLRPVTVTCNVPHTDNGAPRRSACAVVGPFFHRIAAFVFFVCQILEIQALVSEILQIFGPRFPMSALLCCFALPVGLDFGFLITQPVFPEAQTESYRRRTSSSRTPDERPTNARRPAGN